MNCAVAGFKDLLRGTAESPETGSVFVDARRPDNGIIVLARLDSRGLKGVEAICKLINLLQVEKQQVENCFVALAAALTGHLYS